MSRQNGIHAAAVFALILGVCAIAPTRAATIAHWQFSDGSAGQNLSSTGGTQPIATDIVGDREMLSRGSGSQTYSNDVAGPVPGPTSLEFDGSGYAEQVDPGTGDELDDDTLDFAAGEAFTIEGFIKFNVDHTGIFFTKRDGRGIQLHVDTGGTLNFIVDGGGNNNPRISWNDSNLTDNQWHHFAAIREGDGDMRIFVDYVEDTDPANNGKSFVSGTLANDAALTFGANENGGFEFDGFLDEIRISDEVLTPDQFLQTIPEPTTLVLLGLAGTALLGRRPAVRRDAE
jgi:hypothetical protein